MFSVNWGGQIYSTSNAYSYLDGLNKATLVGRAKCDQMKKNGQYQPCFVAPGVMQTGTDSDGNPVYGKNTKKVTPSAYYGQIANKITAPFVYNDNFIKLRQVRLSYSLPQSVVTKTPLQSVTISLIGRNLAYIYNSVPNVDPEAAINSGNGQGIELASIPGTRTIGFNIDIKF